MSDLTPEMKVALNAQMNAEIVNHLMYNEMAGALEALNWPGFSKWMRNAADDEWTHSKKFEEFLIDRNERPVYTSPIVLEPIEAVTPIMCFKTAYELERSNTAKMIALDILTAEFDDVQTHTWLMWAIEEQTRSEREILDAILELDRVGPDGLLILDREYGDKE